MKRIFSSVLVSLALMLTGVTPVQADTLITIAGPSEQLADGRYLSNNLAISISPGGELANSLVNVARGTRTWVIDPAVLEEVADLVDGYVYLDSNGEEVAVEEFVVAQEWLELLKVLSRNDRVVAITYGGPSSAYLQRYAPGELSLYNQLSQSRLALLMGRDVVAPGVGVNGSTNSALVARNSYALMRKTIRTINTVVTTIDVENLRLGIAKTLNPELSQERALALTESYRDQVAEFANRLRVSPGNYTITASRYDLPVTVINDFDQQVTVDLEITTTNSRVVVGEIPRITIDANSQLQIKAPIDVIASGETALRLQLRTTKGSAIGEIERIPLRLAVISPITTWFTTGMAIILLLAAVIQSVRRVRRRKHDE